MPLVGCRHAPGGGDWWGFHHSGVCATASFHFCVIHYAMLTFVMELAGVTKMSGFNNCGDEALELICRVLGVLFQFLAV